MATAVVCYQGLGFQLTLHISSNLDEERRGKTETRRDGGGGRGNEISGRFVSAKRVRIYEEFKAVVCFHSPRRLSLGGNQSNRDCTPQVEPEDEHRWQAIKRGYGGIINNCVGNNGRRHRTENQLKTQTLLGGEKCDSKKRRSEEQKTANTRLDGELIRSDSVPLYYYETS
ncbi:hypothetical protein F2P81_023043 [Scophthalmus maximus]|uniref:Uncharacterized protein n=1 Tax=Scophthalmus maximus TaxID=52904 RepID=A0A6A4RZ32_SCOMX|nr:hypothetical protein F2P81_023043 [Scophthalmus maximus]